MFLSRSTLQHIHFPSINGSTENKELQKILLLPHKHFISVDVMAFGI